MELTEKTLSTERLYEGKIINLRRDRVELPGGRTSAREVVEHPGGVAVLALDDRRRVALVRQYRYSLDEYIYEFPAGLVDPGENFRQAAAREVKEETGLTLSPLTLENGYERPFFTTVGMTDECCATVFGYVSGNLTSEGEEDTEDIEALLVDREEAKRILKEERVAIMCAYMLMHFVADEDPFAFLK